MKKLIRKDIALSVSKHTDLSFYKCDEMVSFLFQEIAREAESGSQVKLGGIGVFYFRDKSRRRGRNPKTGDEHEIKARRKLCLSLCTRLRQDINKEIKA